MEFLISLALFVIISLLSLFLQFSLFLYFSSRGPKQNINTLLTTYTTFSREERNKEKESEKKEKELNMSENKIGVKNKIKIRMF